MAEKHIAAAQKRCVIFTRKELRTQVDVSHSHEQSSAGPSHISDAGLFVSCVLTERPPTINLAPFCSPYLHKISEWHNVTCQVSCQNMQTASPFPPVSAPTEGSHVVIMKGPCSGMWWLQNCLKGKGTHTVESKLKLFYKCVHK